MEGGERVKDVKKKNLKGRKVKTNTNLKDS
jgi:hypothetical protein